MTEAADYDQVDPDIQGILRDLQDPNVSEEEKRQLIRFLAALRDKERNIQGAVADVEEYLREQ